MTFGVTYTRLSESGEEVTEVVSSLTLLRPMSDEAAILTAMDLAGQLNDFPEENRSLKYTDHCCLILIDVVQLAEIDNFDSHLHDGRRNAQREVATGS